MSFSSLHISRVVTHGREVLLLPLLGEQDLPLHEVSNAELSVQRLERRALDHVDRVDNVPERLAHLAAVGISDHGVAEDLCRARVLETW